MTTHSGKPFTAKDVMFSIRRMFEVDGAGAINLANLDLEASAAVDDTTVVLKYPTPYSEVINGLTNYASNMVPEGYDPAKPDGTGPFKFEEFTAGTSSTFVRNENYWAGGPALPRRHRHHQRQ